MRGFRIGIERGLWFGRLLDRTVFGECLTGQIKERARTAFLAHRARDGRVLLYLRQTDRPPVLYGGYVWGIYLE